VIAAAAMAVIWHAHVEGEAMTPSPGCVYCVEVDSEAPEPVGGVVLADEQWFVAAGDPASTIAGALRITSRRHFIHFADMTAHEVTGFGTLLARLDAALRTVTDAERVHLVSTRDRFEHFHAWLYPRSADHPLRGTEFLNAPQSSDPGEALTVANAVRDQLR
jgi:diadenosine tetraphosphate (Ap4A) HIT family hydrolase